MKAMTITINRLHQELEISLEISHELTGNNPFFIAGKNTTHEFPHFNKL